MTHEDSDGGDGVWGDGDESGHDVHEELAREEKARRQGFYNAGYREGIEEGKAKTLQHGFNIGFKEGAQAGLRWGEVSASIKTLQIFAGQVAGSSQFQQAVGGLAQELSKITPRQAMLAACSETLSSVPHDKTEVPGETSAPADRHQVDDSSDNEGPRQEGVSVQELQEAMSKLPGLIEQASAERQRDMAIVSQGSLPSMTELIQDLKEKLATIGIEQWLSTLDDQSTSLCAGAMTPVPDSQPQD